MAKRSKGGSKGGRKYSRSAQESVHTEMRHRKSRKHGTMSRKQAVAVGLSKARRSGKKVPARPKGSKRKGGGRKK